MINAKASLSTKFGSFVIAITDEDVVFMYVIVPDLVSGAYFITILTLEAVEDIENDEDLQQFINDTMPDVINYCCDKVSRVRYLYEFGCVNKVDMSCPLDKGEYFIAVEKEFEGDDSALSIIGTCDDGSSFLDEETVRNVYRKLEEHSYDSVGLPVLEEDQITVTKFTVFRI